MSNYKVPQDLNIFHVLTLIYLSFAHQTDGELADSERAVINNKIGEWMGDDATRGQVDALIDEAIDWYNSIPGERDAEGVNQRIMEMVKHIKVVRDYMDDEKNRRAVYNDVAAIVQADGTVTEAEEGWLQLLKNELAV